MVTTATQVRLNIVTEVDLERIHRMDVSPDAFFFPISDEPTREMLAELTPPVYLHPASLGSVEGSILVTSSENSPVIHDGLQLRGIQVRRR